MNNQLDAKPLITLLDYQSTSVVDLFSAIESQPWAMLLHSSAKEHVDNRYDILVADPIATLQTHQALKFLIFILWLVFYYLKESRISNIFATLGPS